MATVNRSREWQLPALMGIVAGVIGVLGSAYMYYTAQAAVEVRPKLEDVGFIDAFLTNHGADWLFYHYPVPAAVGVVTLCVIMGVLFGVME